MKLLIINGPNLNLVGKREPAIYGDLSLDGYIDRLREEYARRGVVIEAYQTNIEGEIVSMLQQADGIYDGVILNAGGYTHTSVAIADAIKAVSVPVVEVHISNIFAREDYRRISITAAACRGAVTGFGLQSYRIAVEGFITNV